MARDLSVNILAPSQQFEAGVKRMEASARQLHASELRLVAVEERLEKLRTTGKATAGQLASAQASVISAQDKVAKSTGQVAAATEQQGKRSSKAFAGIGTAASAMGGAVGLGAAAAGVAMVAFARQSISAASDLQEQMSATKTIFKGAADEVIAFGESAESIGISTRAALEASNGFGDLFTKIGYTSDAAATFSEDLVRVAADFASFKNLQPEEALEKLRAGLAGETEPLRSLGVFLNEAKVKAEAMRLGLLGAHGELDEGAKVAARYSLILGQMGEAEGDVARTADSYANTQRRFSAEMENLQATVGSGVLPMLTDLATIATNVADSLSSAENAAGKGGGGWKGRVEGWLDVLDVWERIPGALDKLAGGSDKAKEATDEYADSREQLANKEARAREEVALSAKEVEKQQAALEKASPEVRAYAEELGLGADAIKVMSEQLEGWSDQLAAFVSPLGAYTGKLKEKEEAERAAAEKTAEATEDSKDSWEDYVDEVGVTFDEYIAELKEQVAAQQDWSSNMLLLAGRVSEGTLEELAKMGPEGAPLVADLVKQSDAELAKLEPLFAARSKSAVDAQAVQWRQWGVLAPQLTAKIGKDAVAGLARELEAGTTTVADISRRYAFELAGGITPLLRAVGKNGVTLTDVNRDVAMVQRGRRFADGGFEDHIAQIAQPGVVPRVWAERETGGEAYIPLAPSKRQRSVGIWEETGRRLGVFAKGGFFSERDVPPLPSTRPFGPPISTAADATMGAGRAAALEFLRQSMMASGSGSVAADGELSSNAARAKAAVLARFGRMTIGGWGTRPNPTEHDDMIGGKKASRALDFMTTNVALGNAIADFMHTFPGATYSIWNRRIRRAGGDWQPYSGRSPHTDHVHTSYMAKGGILNPHVRDSGGPLLPGFTFNGTRRPEMVLPMAAGGVLGPIGRATSARPVTAAQIIASAGTSVLYGAVNKGVWDALQKAGWSTRANDGTNKGMIWRPGAGLGDPTQRRAATARPRTLTDATRGLVDPTAVRAAAQAWEDQNDALLRNRALLADLVAAQKELAQARGTSAKDVAQAKREMDTDLKLAKTKADRAEAYKKYDAVVRKGAEARSDAYRNIAEAQQAIRDQQAEDALQRERTAVDRLVESLEQEQRVREEKLDALNRMLDRERDVRAKGVEAERDFADKAARIQERSAAAAQELALQQRRLLDERRDQLSGWARLDERAAVQWGNSVQQLLANARDQAAQFEQWSSSLADARARGVSEQVIAALGLDEGPQALGQLRQFGQATAAEIDALNREVARRTELAGAQVSREQQAGYGDLGQALQAAHADYTRALADLNEELVQAQADLLVEQAEVATELAAIGQDQARAYGEALEQGLRSQIPAVLAAAQALQAAAGGATGNATMRNGRYVDTMTGRAAFFGPNGEPGYAAGQAPAGSLAHRMPDGRTAYYLPSQQARSMPVQQAAPQQLVVHNYTMLDGQVIDHRVETKLLRRRGIAAVTGAR